MMLRNLSVLLAAVALAGPVAAQAPKAAPAKSPPAKAAPARPAQAKPAPAAAAGPFNAQDPAALAGLLNAAGAKAQVGPRDADAVLVTVTSPAADFTVQFVGCDGQGRACKAALFDFAAKSASPTLAHLNGFNQSSALCRSYQARGGVAHVVYSALLFRGDMRQEMTTHVDAWRGCLGDFAAFLKDPPGYLAAAP